MAVSVNTLIGTRYRLDEKIGQGGMGTVYRGLDTQTGEMVAVKQLQPAAVASEPGVLERFSREGVAHCSAFHAKKRGAAWLRVVGSSG